MRQDVARALAKLHSVQREYWGEIKGRRKARSYGETMKRAIEKRLGRLGDSPERFPGGQIEALREWFLERVEALADAKSFQLCHHHLHGDDIIYDPKMGRITIIDCASLQFSRASRDVSNLAEMAWMGDAQERNEFLEYYFSCSPDERRSEYKVEGPLYTAFHLLNQLYRLVRKSGIEGMPGAAGNKFDSALKHLTKITQGGP